MMFLASAWREFCKNAIQMCDLFKKPGSTGRSGTNLDMSDDQLQAVCETKKDWNVRGNTGNLIPDYDSVFNDPARCEHSRKINRFIPTIGTNFDKLKEAYELTRKGHYITKELILKTHEMSKIWFIEASKTNIIVPSKKKQQRSKTSRSTKRKRSTSNDDPCDS